MIALRAGPGEALATSVWALAALVAAALVSGALASGSTAAGVAVLGLLAAGVAMLVLPRWRTPLLAALFALVPFDLSKAVIAPLVSRYHPAGPYYSPGLYLTLADAVLLLLLPVWLGRRWLLERRALPFTRLDALAAAFLAWVWMRSIGTPQGALAIGTALAYSFAVLGFWVVSHALETRADIRLVLRASLVGFVATLIEVVGQIVTRSPLSLPGGKVLAIGSVVTLGDAGEAFRPPGFMNHPNSLAHYMVVVLAPALALVLVGRRALPRGVWWAALATGLGALAALLVTLSRGGWVAAAVAGSVVVALALRRGVLGLRGLGVLALVGALGIAAVLVAYPSALLRLTAPDGRSLESRGLLVDMARTIVATHPWVGIGFGDFNRVAFQTSPPLYANVSDDYQEALHQLIVHNHYLLLAAELGIPAMLFFAYLLWRFVRQVLPLRRWRDPFGFGLATGLAAAIVGQAVFLTSDNYYVDIRIFMLWLSAGVLQALALQADRSAAALLHGSAPRAPVATR